MFIVSPSPHTTTCNTTSKIMFGVVVALIPAMATAVAFFGLGALRAMVVAVVSCVLIEYFIQKFIMKTDVTISDGSAVVSGLLLAFNVPATVPWWVIVIGSVVTIGVAKMSFGGLGKNPFNPAIVGRLFMVLSFPSHMTNWTMPRLWDFSEVDGQTGATALGMVKEAINSGSDVSSLNLPSYWYLFIGYTGGCIGEISALALLLGGLYMLLKKIISWHIPIAYLGTVALGSFLLWHNNPTGYGDPLLHLLSGGLMLGAIFMATDYSSSPMTNKGKLVFGIGCGLLTIIIRSFGAFAEGVGFSILIMNAFVPLINDYFKPRVFGSRGENE